MRSSRRSRPAPGAAARPCARVLGAAVAMVLVAGCTADGDRVGSDGATATTGGAPASAPPPSQGPLDAPPSERAPSRTPEGAAPNVTAANDGTASGAATVGGDADDGGALGTAGRHLLSPANRSVTIEVDRSPRARLRVDPRRVLADALRAHGGKEAFVAAGDSAVAAQDVYTADDLRAITAVSRASTSVPGRPAVYVLVLEGRFEDERAVGVAFAATAFAVFPDQIGGGLLGLNADAFETAVLVHELGHLFGLVNLTGRGSFHEDPQHPGHSRSAASVMYWAVDDVSIVDIFGDGPPQGFDDDDRREMAAIRGA